VAETFGDFFGRIRRDSQKLSLREFCSRNGFDPGNLSRLERGRIPPPKSRDVLEGYAYALGLEEGSSDWYSFFDLAALSRGELPEDLMENEEVLDKLPILFRTLRGDPVDGKKLDELIELIRKA
jgi:transcriptional regulator with XRE-family HTH domain